MDKNYNLGARVFWSFNDNKIYGCVSDFKNIDEFKRYLIGEENVDKDYFDHSYIIKTVYMRYLPKGNHYSENEPCYVECKKNKGASEYYMLGL